MQNLNDPSNVELKQASLPGNWYQNFNRIPIQAEHRIFFKDMTNPIKVCGTERYHYFNSYHDMHQFIFDLFKDFRIIT